MLKLHDDEQLIAVFRKHIFEFMVQVFWLIIIALILLLAYPFLRTFFSPEPSLQFVYFFAFIYLIVLIVLWNAGFVLWTNYYLDMWILTDKRLMDVDQKSLFAREVSSLRLDRIQDVKVEVLGFIHTMVGMGSVHVQTAASEKEFIIHNVKKPEEVKKQILAAYNKQMEEVKTVRVAEVAA